jgi:hypothetical protein
MNFENQIQNWVSIDNQLRILSEKMKELRDKKNTIGENILEHAKKNNLTKSTIQISDGRLRFTNTKVANPLTFKYLEKSLSEIIANESQVKAIVEHLKQNREFKMVEDIKRFSVN